jgi:Leucine-rich repeat (LRR) protein
MSIDDERAVRAIFDAASKPEDMREHKSIREDGRIVKLDLSGCFLLTTLQREIGEMEKLTELKLAHCWNLTTLPPEIGNLTQLTLLNLVGCKSLTTLPCEIGKLDKLARLSLDNCTSLETLPTEIGNLNHLTKISFSGCTSLTTLPPRFGNLNKLKTLNLHRCTSLKLVPTEIGDLKELTKLDLSGCTSWTTLPCEIGKLTNLIELDLSGCTSWTTMPSAIGNLTNLTTLHLSDCSSLTALPPEIGNLDQLPTLDLCHCTSLTTLPPEIGNLNQLTFLDLSNCTSLTTLFDIEQDDFFYEDPTLYDDAQTQSKRRQRQFPMLHQLYLSGCRNLTKLRNPEIEMLLQLEVLRLSDCSNLATLSALIGMLQNLETLDLTYCKKLKELPFSLLQLTKLKYLALHGSALPVVQVLLREHYENEWIVRWEAYLLGCGIKIPDGTEECWVVSSNDNRIKRAEKTSPEEAACSKNVSRIDQFMLVSRDFSGKLDFSNSSLSHLPDTLHKLHKLTALDISNNDNIRTVERDLSECRNLKKVIMKDCEYAAELLGSLDSILDSAEGKKKVSWEDQPPYEPKLLIKFLTCAVLLAMEIFTIISLTDDKAKDVSQTKCNKFCGTKYDSQTCETVCEMSLHMEELDNENISLFKYLVAALSLILLVPPVVDVGNMMYQFLNVPFRGKIHKILEKQEELAERTNVLEYLGRGVLLSILNALCCFWCISPSDVDAGGPAANDLPTNGDVESVVPINEESARNKSCVSRKFKRLLYSEDGQRLEWTRLCVIVIEWLDTVQTLALLPLSWYVIMNSSTVVDVLVNVVSVSLFARLDDETVEMFMKPQQSLVDRWILYTGSEEDLRRSARIKIEAKRK